MREQDCLLPRAVAKGIASIPNTPRLSPPMPAILALDQGTTSSRVIVFDHAGGMFRFGRLLRAER